MSSASSTSGSTLTPRRSPYSAVGGAGDRQLRDRRAEDPLLSVLLAVEEGPPTGGWAGEVVAFAVEGGTHEIDDIWRLTIWRLTTADDPIPFSPPLEDAFLPGADAIVASVSERLGVGSQQQSHAGTSGG